VGRQRVPYGRRRSQHGDLWLPVPGGSAAAAHPVVVLIHGGFWRSAYGMKLMDGLAADIAGRGWAAWNLEYRRVGRWSGGGWPATFDDVAAGIDHLASLAEVHPLDLTRVVTIGHSAGGHLALWAAAPGRSGSGPGRVTVSGALGLGAVSDLEQAALTGLGRGAALELLGGPPERYPDRYAAASPFALVPLGVPQVLVHGCDDDTVPVAMSERYVERAAAAGDVATLVALPGVGHFEPIDPTTPAWGTTVDHLKQLLA
jgi:acetyl esterase/lipase